MEALGSQDERVGTGVGRDPYPLSPTSVRWNNIDEEPQQHRGPSRISEADSEVNRERADIVMSLDAKGRMVKQGRSQFDWGNLPGPRSPINSLPQSQLQLTRSYSGTRGSQRSYASHASFQSQALSRGHSRQGSAYAGASDRG